MRRSHMLFFVAVFYSFALHGQEGYLQDSIRVNQLLKLSKSHQWKDSYVALDYADQALAIAQNSNYLKGIAMASNLKGFCYWAFGDNDLAIQAGLQALQIAERENFTAIAAESHYILARGYMDIADVKKASAAISKAEALANKTGNWEQLCSIYNLKGVILFIDQKYDSALHLYNKAFESGKTHGVAPIQFPRIISNIGECYVAQNPALALTYFTNAVALAKETGNRIAEASITSIIGHFYLRANDLKSAERYLQSALGLARDLGLRRVIRHAYSGLVDIRLKEKNGDEAVVYLRRYYEVRDSLLSTSKIREIVEMENKHELEMKEQNIKILENEKRIQTIWKNLLIALVGFVVLGAIGLYQFQRYRYKRNREMLNLEIDYLTQQHKETIDRVKAAMVADSSERIESHDQRLLKKAISIVEENIADSQLSVEVLAARLNMSRTNLHRKMKAITGFPPSELIRSIRLRKAARLILSKADSVSQIALLVGFDDYSHFSKSFKKHFGVSPTSYHEFVQAGAAEPEKREQV